MMDKPSNPDPRRPSQFAASMAGTPSPQPAYARNIDASLEDDEYDDEPDEREGRGHWFFFMVVLLSAGVIIGGYYGLRESVQRGYLDQFMFVYDNTRLLPTDQIETLSSEDTVQIFLSKDGRTLSPYPRRLRRNTPDPEKARLIVEEVIAPTGAAGMISLLPEGTQSRGFFQVGSTAYVDLSRQFLEAREDRSPRAERLAVYSIINSVALNIPDIQAVQILVEGNPIDTVWGYVDCSTPLGPDPSLIH